MSEPNYLRQYVYAATPEVTTRKSTKQMGY